MIDAIDASDGRLRIRSASGRVAFDTDQKAWIHTDFIGSESAGQITLPERVARSYTTNGTNEFYEPVILVNNVPISSINPVANVVNGMFKVGVAGSGYYNDAFYNKWHQCSGTIIGELFPRQFNNCWCDASRSCHDASVPRRHDFVSGLVLYTFIASGGTLTLRENVVLTTFNPLGYGWRGNFSLTIPERVVDFRLLCGAFL